MNILIVGGNGGIGMGLIGRLLQPDSAVSDRLTTVHATYRRSRPTLEHPQLCWHHLDATDEVQVEALSKQLGPLHWIVNTVGILHNENWSPEKTVRKASSEQLLTSIHINTLPTLLLAKHFLVNLRHREPAIFAVISAKVGSITDNRLGGWYSYRMSKAALNMAIKCLSIEWRQALPNVCVAALHPGTTDSALSQPFQQNVPAQQLFSPGTSANFLIDQLIRLQPEDSGNFWSWDGSRLPW